MTLMMSFYILAKAPRGDPNPIGWLTTFAYFCVSGFCFWAGLREKEQAIGRARVRHAPLFWFTLCGVMVALGFNKQLDIQSDITQLGRDMAVSEGWYQNRRIVQSIFVVCFGLAAVTAVLAGLWFMRDLWRRYRMAFVGIVYLCTFVIIRAASFHHIDTLLYHVEGVQYLVNTTLELGGIAIVGYAAYRAANPKPEGQVYRAYERKVRVK